MTKMDPGKDNKLSKKYSGKELEYKLKQRMYQKGFSYNDYE